MVDATSVEATRTRREVSKRSFRSADGTYTSRANTSSVGFRIEFVENGHVIEHSLSDFPEGVRNAAAAFGLVTSITNTFGGVKGPVEDAIEAAEDRLAVFLEGDWSAERQTGPRSSQLVEAFKALRDDHGLETTDDRIAKFVEDLKNEEYAKTIMKDVQFAAKLQAIRAKAAAERAAKLAAKAESAEGSTLLD